MLVYFLCTVVLKERLYFSDSLNIFFTLKRIVFITIYDLEKVQMSQKGTMYNISFQCMHFAVF